MELKVTYEEANEIVCNALSSAFVRRFELCELSLTEDLLTSLMVSASTLRRLCDGDGA